MKDKIDFKYNSTVLTREDILNYSSWKTTKRDCVCFFCNTVNRIRSEYCRIYRECCCNFAELNNFRILLERALLTHNILINFLLFDFSILLTIFSNLKYLFASFLYNILYFLILVSNRVTTLTRYSSFLQKIKSICFNLFRNITQICLRLYQNTKY